MKCLKATLWIYASANTLACLAFRLLAFIMNDIMMRHLEGFEVRPRVTHFVMAHPQIWISLFMVPTLVAALLLTLWGTLTPPRVLLFGACVTLNLTLLVTMGVFAFGPPFVMIGGPFNE